MESHIKLKNVWQVKNLQERLSDVATKEVTSTFFASVARKEVMGLFFGRTIGGMPEGVQEASR
jgi:hypothetical protein